MNSTCSGDGASAAAFASALSFLVAVCVACAVYYVLSERRDRQLTALRDGALLKSTDWA